MNVVEKYRGRLIKVAYFALLLGAFYLFMKYAFTLFLPFMIAFVIATLLQKPVDRLSKNKYISRGFASAALSLLVYSIIGTRIAFVGVWLVGELKSFFEFLAGKFNALPEFIGMLEGKILNFIKFLPDKMEASAAAKISEWAKLLSEDTAAGASSIGGAVLKKIDLNWIASPLSGIVSTAMQLPSFLIAFVITIISTCFLTTDYGRLKNFVKRQLPKDRVEGISSGKKILKKSLKNLGKAYLAIMGITFVEMLIGLLILRLIGILHTDYIFVIAFITAIVDIFPIFGTGTILIPWSLYSLVTGNYGMALGIIIIYIVISVLRQFIEPKMVATNLGLPPIVTIAGIYIGLKLFGVLGVFIVPIIVIMIKLLNDEGILHLWNK